jgi:hypothetical protein
MFDFLNKLSHNHSATPQLSVEAINQDRKSDSSDNEGPISKRSQKAANNEDKINPPSISDKKNKIQLTKSA